MPVARAGRWCRLKVYFIESELIGQSLYLTRWRWLTVDADGMIMVWTHRPVWADKTNEWICHTEEADCCRVPWTIRWLGDRTRLYCLVHTHRTDLTGGGRHHGERPADVSSELTDEEVQRLGREVYGRPMVAV